jgi:hypothetical protein
MYQMGLNRESMTDSITDTSRELLIMIKELSMKIIALMLKTSTVMSKLKLKLSLEKITEKSIIFFYRSAVGPSL